MCDELRNHLETRQRIYILKTQQKKTARYLKQEKTKQKQKNKTNTLSASLMTPHCSQQNKNKQNSTGS